MKFQFHVTFPRQYYSLEFFPDYFKSVRPFLERTGQKQEVAGFGAQAAVWRPCSEPFESPITALSLGTVPLSHCPTGTSRDGGEAVGHRTPPLPCADHLARQPTKLLLLKPAHSTQWLKAIWEVSRQVVVFYSSTKFPVNLLGRGIERFACRAAI